MLQNSYIMIQHNIYRSIILYEMISAGVQFILLWIKVYGNVIVLYKVYMGLLFFALQKVYTGILLIT